MEDKNLVCKDCGGDFVHSVRDQEFFAQKGFTDPVRCGKCRAAKKARSFNNGGGRR